ncbi:unnamed protein product [Haemonchus placei]|uniref:Uncharacterized protein n=1 Tax=Haemonchus placei TaxID=6290 RepID=A0A0N4X2U7_HAEPC|nr:unnamed protein product [Haemonchus placei]
MSTSFGSSVVKRSERGSEVNAVFTEVGQYFGTAFFDMFMQLTIAIVESFARICVDWRERLNLVRRHSREAISNGDHKLTPSLSLPAHFCLEDFSKLKLEGSTSSTVKMEGGSPQSRRDRD